jgi:hypothetical protein
VNVMRVAHVLAGIVAAMITVGVAPAARADGKPLVAGKSAKPVESAPPVTTDVAATIFRADGFGKSDAESDRVTKKLVEACAESPFSREGMDFESAAKCNAQVARAIQRGKKAIPSILRLLEADGDGAQGSGEMVGYYARTRLFHVLGKSDSLELEEVLLAGMSKIAKDKNDDRSNDVTLAHEALVKMNGLDPTGLAVAAAGAVENVHVATTRRVAAWRAFLADHEKEKKIKVRTGALATAWADARSKDTKKRYLALSALAAQSPRKAKKLIDAATEEVPEAEQEAFVELMSIAWSFDPEVPELPRPPKVRSKKTSMVDPPPRKPSASMPTKSRPEPPPRAQSKSKSKI